MQGLAISALILLLASGQSAAASDDSLDSPLITALTKMGAIHQLAKDCGASDDILSKFEAQTLSDIDEMKQDNPDLNLDFAQAYTNGKKIGAQQFADLEADAKGSQACSMAIFRAERM